MRIIQHVSCNDHIAFGDSASCEPAPCVRTTYAGVNTITTYWKPSPEEIAALGEGRLLRIEVMGGSMPPFSTMVDGQERDPFPPLPWPPLKLVA